MKVAVLSVWGALSDERAGLPFVRVSKSFVIIYIGFTNLSLSTNECTVYTWPRRLLTLAHEYIFPFPSVLLFIAVALRGDRFKHKLL
jgi:hypothetical protein